MKSHFTRLLIPSILAVLVAVTWPASLQAQYVYVDDNNTGFGLNSATGFSVVAGPALSIIPGSPFGTTSTGLGTFPAPVQEVAISYGVPNQACLFVSDPLGTSTFPNGDVAAFVINTTNGTLTPAGNFVDPTDTSGPNKYGIPLAVDRRIGFPYFFAAFTGENKIAFYKVVTTTCQLAYASSTPAIGLSGAGPVQGLAVSKAGPHIVVTTYGDGSVQSFKVLGGTLGPLSIFNSTGFTTPLQGGIPAGVDITKNGKYAVFGDRQPGFAEVEVAKILPSGVLAPTVDYGGPVVASGVTLGPGLNSQNLWISPGPVGGLNYLYITNNSSGQVTTAHLSSTTGVVSQILSSACTGGYTNPTTLTPAAWILPAGVHTVKTTPSGTGIVVAEFGAPSSVALLAIQNASGCTKEVPGSPFIDPFSNFGLYSIDVFPSRPF
jgi:hypothetical protein